MATEERARSRPKLGRPRFSGLGREGLALASILLGALALRLLQLQQIHRNDPFFALPAVDGKVYHEWALALAGGDWLGREVFFLGPLYPYFLGVLYALAPAGQEILTAKLVQSLLGVATCALVWRLGRRLFDARVGLLAAGMTAVYGMLLFYEGTLMLVNLLVPLTLALILALVSAHERPGLLRWLLVGGLLGLCALARQNVLLFGPLALGWLLWDLRERATLARRLAWAAALGLGTLLAVSPATLRNYAVSGEVVLINAAGAAPFYTGNNPRADGTFKVAEPFPRELAGDPVEQVAAYRAYAERALGRPLSASEVSDYWVGRGLAWIVAHPGDWLRLELRKLALFVNHHEAANNRQKRLSELFSWVLRLPLLGFGFVAPLGLLGLGLTTRHARRLVPVYGMIAVYLATALLFFVLSRYRMPIVPLLIVFAAAAVFELLERARAGRRRALALAGVALAALAVVVHLPLRQVDLSTSYYNLGNRYRQLQRWDLAIASYERAIDENPGYLSAYNNLAGVHERRGGDRAAAIRTWEIVLQIATQRRLGVYIERASRHLRELRAGRQP